MAAPVLSVVMPSLNQRPFIGAAVRSVMTQDVGGLELVVQDGGSLDGSLTELAALSAEFAGRLRWTSGPDAGPADAIHRAIVAARAPVIGWLNSDDLYTPGAARRALEHLAQHGDHVMVYGHGEHVDAQGALLERYPSLPPSTPLAAFADGNFICQPTVFFRRDAYLAAGGLDNLLRTAFDFDLWLRLFKAHPGGIGFIDTVQARSRLHAGSITLRMRERVAMEGLTVIRRHLGPAPGHWLLTHLEELCAQHPFHGQPKDLRIEFERLVQQALPLVGAATADALAARLQGDRRLQLARPHLYVATHPDGWAAPVLDVRLRQPAQPVRAIVLACEHASPAGKPLSITVVSPDGRVQALRVDGNGPFEFSIEVPDCRPQAQAVFRILSEGAFVPAQDEPGSADQRQLAFKVLGCRLLPEAS
jgi:glycosyltransferase involved in cell wall biosynthesis